MSRQSGNSQCKSYSRSTLKFEPEFDGPIAGWAVNYIKKNLWRFTPFLDFDDLYQEAYIKFQYVADKYPEVVEPKHFMSLFKISLINHFHSLSWKRTNTQQMLLYESDTDGVYEEMIASMVDPSSEADIIFNVLVNEAPKEIQELLKVILNETIKKHFRKRHPKGTSKGGQFVLTKLSGLYKRETTNEFFCRLINCNSKDVNLVTMLQKHFG